MPESNHGSGNIIEILTGLLNEEIQSQVIMDTLKYYTKENNFYTGVNTPQFKNLEFWIDSNLGWINDPASVKNREARFIHGYYKEIPNNIVSLGLFGEASAGKTSAVRHAAKILGKHLIILNGAQFQNSTFEDLMFDELLKLKWGVFETVYDSIERIFKSSKYTCLIPEVIFFIDECHELPKKVQTRFLSLLEGPIQERVIRKEYSEILEERDIKFRKEFLPDLAPTEKEWFGRDILLNKSIFAFATTDPSRLLQPLVTRLHRISFDKYSLEDVTNIIKLKFPNGEDAGLELIAKCSKYTPREAIRMAEQIQTVYKSLTKETCSAYLTGVINMDTNGLDSIDYRLLRFLIGNKKELSTRQKIELESNKSLLAHLLLKPSKTESEQRNYMKSLAIVSTLSEIQSGEFTPKGKEDIAMSCGMYDFKDVDTRLSFMQSLGLVEKTSRGVVFLPNNGLTLDETKLL